VKQLEAKRTKPPQLRLDEYEFISLLKNCRQNIPARILMISCPSQKRLPKQVAPWENQSELWP
jgi:hypothetical protein